MNTIQETKVFDDRPEIVAPAGNEESFWAAIVGGADAVYLGLKDFNARRRADNFDLKDLPDIIREAHLRNVKVYVTLNILLKNSELFQALETAAKVLEAGADALILQDLGFARMLRKTFPDARLHASTQINAHNSATVAALQNLGFKRVVLARELEITEIKNIIKKTGVEAEVFVHGALCYCYSGQCLLSSLVGRRSGNRGLCAQPCRLPYVLVAFKDGRKIPLKVPYDYLLSTKDLLGIYHLHYLIEAGVKALKIEGRLKSPEYVSLTTQVYSRELRRALELKSSYEPLKESVELLEEAFSRGFSPAYLIGQRSNEMMSYNRPNNRGGFIGRVSYVDEIQGRVGIALRRDISIGDVLEFWTSKKGRVTQKIKELFSDSGSVETVQAGQRAHVGVEKDRHLIKPGDRVYRVINSRLLKTITRELREATVGSILLEFHVEIVEDGTARVEARAGDKQIVFTEKIKMEKAEKTGTTPEIVKNQLAKLGGTPYVAAAITVKMPKGYHVKIKELNSLRRKAVEMLNKLRLEEWQKEVKPAVDFDFWLKKLSVNSKRQKLTPIFAVKIRDYEFFKLALKERPDVIFVRYPFFRNSGLHRKEDLDRLIAAALGQDIAFGLAFPQVMKEKEVEDALELLEDYREVVSYVLADNLGFAVEVAKRRFNVWTDYHLNIFNSLTAKVYSDLGARFSLLSVELNLNEIKNILRTSSFNAGILLAGDIELMVAEHCPLTALAQAENLSEIKKEDVPPCVLLAKEKQLYPRFCELARYYLRDKANYEFPVRSDVSCRGYLYNSRFLCAIDYLAELYEAGVGLFVVDLAGSRLLETQDVEKILSFVRQSVDLMKRGKKPKASAFEEDFRAGSFTRGHYERGVF
jgi:putative protease